MKIRVLLALGNKLLSEALKELLVSSNCEFQIKALFPLHDISDSAWRNHEVIVTDYLSLSKIPRDCFECSRVLIMDNGLERETIVSLFLTESIAGFIKSDSTINNFLKAIKVVNEGEVWIDNDTTKSLLNQGGSRKVNDSAKLTEREVAITKLIQEGYRNKDIARLLSISEQTVKSHINRIFRKMNVSGRTELVNQLSNYADI